MSEWKEPARRGRRVYDDHAFVKSLQDQYARRSSLSPRQVSALRRVLYNYRAQIPEFDTVAERLGLVDPPDGGNVNDAEADAKADAKAEFRASRTMRRRRTARRS